MLYCSTTEAGAYWETRPKNGDVITLSQFELKEGAKVNCNVVDHQNKVNQNGTHPLQIVGAMLSEFLIDAFSLEVSRDRPKDYLFSSLLASEQLFYRVATDNNIQAMIYPSVQKKKFGTNFAIKNELIFEKYNLIGVETRFILDEFENINPQTEELITDNLISSFATETFDFVNGKILYNEDAKHLFKLSRRLQTGAGKQFRYDNPGNVKNLTFNVSANRAAQWPESFKSN